MTSEEAFDFLLQQARSELKAIQDEIYTFTSRGQFDQIEQRVVRGKHIQGLIQKLEQDRIEWVKTFPNVTKPRIELEQAINQVRLPNFWWITTSPAIWLWENLFKNPHQTEWFHGRKKAENFALAKPGDFVFGYQAGPVRKMVVLARVSRGLYEHKDRMVIDIQGIGSGLLVHPVPWATIKRAIPNSEPIHNNAQGTLFRLTPEEGKILARLIKQAGNIVILPDELNLIQQFLWP